MREENLLLPLPEDILRHILHEWIGSTDLYTVVTLDIGICHKITRGKYLSCLKGRNVSFVCTEIKNTKTLVTLISRFVRWSNIRDMLVDEMEISNINYLNWDLSKLIENTKSLKSLIVNCNDGEDIEDQWEWDTEEWENVNVVHTNKSNLRTILTALPILKILVLNVEMSIWSTIPNLVESSFSLCLEQLTLLTPMNRADFFQLIEFVGKYAKQLVYLKAFCHRYEDFPQIVKFLSTVEELECEFHRNDYLIAQESLIFPEEFLDTTKKCPQFKTVTLFYIPRALLVPFLRKCAQMKSLNVCFHEQASSMSIDALVEVFPQLKKCLVYGNVDESFIANLFRAYPSSTVLTEFDTKHLNDELLSMVVSKFPSIQVLSMIRGELPTALSLLYSTPTLSNQQHGLCHLKHITIEDVDISNAAYTSFLAHAHTGCPSLYSVSISFTCDQLDEDKFFIQLLHSPLHQQLQILCITGTFDSSFDSIPWETVPVWEKLKIVSFINIPILCPLSQWFERTPNLQSFVLNKHLLSALGSTESINEVEGYLALCAEAFQRVPKLRYFSCEIDPMDKRITLEFWITLIRSCASLRILDVDDMDEECYWEIHQATRDMKTALMKMFKYGLALRNIVYGDVVKISRCEQV
jgi:hypothetical protein